MKRDTIKNHADFAMSPDDPVTHNSLFLVRMKPAKIPGDARYGLVVTKRTFRFAVTRNLVKRRLRDWIAFNEDLMLPEYDYIFVARHEMRDATREDGRDAMRKALHYLRREHGKGKK